ncbi:MAG: aminopeptidase [Spirochaetales bacterium]|nr:aminopeptidase [Spirochaetales bacterium]
MNRRQWLKILVLAVSCMFFQGCYLLKQGFYLFRYTFKAEDNRTLLADSDTPESTRAFLQRVEDITAFAQEALGLLDNKNYSKYVRVDQDFLAWVVSATEEFSFQPYLWSYPLVGKMPYQGFYEEKDAVKEAHRLKKKGYDVWVRKVEAFSTLGYLTDPLYSYMEDYSVYSLANLLIHEQAHATLFLKGQGEFNESFATFVGDLGAKLYIARTYGTDSQEYTSIFINEHDRAVFLEQLGTLKSALEDLYTRRPPQMKEAKQAEIEAFKQRFRSSYRNLFIGEGYTRVPDIPMNNAFISLYALYHSDTDLFYRVYEQFHGDLKTCIQTLVEAAAGSKDGFEEVKNLLQPRG